MKRNLIIALILGICSFACDRDEITVAVYYFPNYHPSDARMNALNGDGWSEWELVKSATPRFEEHSQPRVPVWGYTDESDPLVMSKKIDAAADHDIDVFIFDWYWDNEGIYWERGLENGFLEAANNNRIEFALMWAMWDFYDMFPYSRGQPIEVLYPGKVDPETFERACDYMIEKYFKHPSYWKIDGKPYLSIYDLDLLIQSFGTVEAARSALDAFRDKARQAGFPDIHLNAIAWSPSSLVSEKNPAYPANTVEQLGFISVTSYVWIHHIKLPQLQTEYGYVKEEYFKYLENAEEIFDVPVFPNVSMGWDPSPRTNQDDHFGDFGYPFTNTISGNTPEQFYQALLEAKKRLLETQGPQIVTINSWNEWSEGSYLEPDTEFGYGYLEALREAFSPDIR